jgi:hypothetical protein
MARDHGGYLRRVAQLQAMWSLLPSTWQLSAVGAISAVTGYLGFQAGGYFYAALGAIAAFCLGSIGVFFTILISRAIGIYGKLTIKEIGVSAFAPEFSSEARSKVITAVKNLTMNVVVQNNSMRDIHFKVSRCDLSILGRVNPDATISAMTHIVPAGQTQPLIVPTIERIDLPKTVPDKASALTGRIILQIEYGPSSEVLPYRLLYEADPIFGLGTIAGATKNAPSQVSLSVICPIRKYVHERV